MHVHTNLLTHEPKLLFFIETHTKHKQFYMLETVARIPYFSYISMLHLYETLGWWTIGTDVRRVHFAEGLFVCVCVLVVCG